MGEITFLAGVAFLNQTTRGTVNASLPAIGSGSGTGSAIDNATDGAVLGDSENGIGSSGISLELGKNIIEKAVVSGSFTRDFANFVSRTVESFSMVVPMKGNGETTTATPVAADFTPDVGIVALLRAAGLSGSASGATWQFVPAATDLISAAVYLGNEANNGIRLRVRDIEASALTMAFTPGEPALMTFDLLGEYDSADESGSWPANPFDYGNQSTLSAPSVVDVNFTWGPDTPAARSIGFSELTITIDNATESVPSSNAASGSVARQTDREITISGTIDADDGEFLYELSQLGESDIANAEALSFTVGTAATGSDTANAYQIQVPDPELVSLAPNVLGASQAWDIELRARASTANGEFSLTFL